MGVAAGTFPSGNVRTSFANYTRGTAVDLMIDASTGLSSASRDVSGIETELEYDALGRLTWEKPASGHGA